jgi:hypothetical protein
METKRDVLENLVLAELVRLQQDHSMLESLHERLPECESQPNVQAKFISLWADVENRADRLERLLDEMTWFGLKPVKRVVCISSRAWPPAAA